MKLQPNWNKSYVKGVVVKLGPLSTTGRLISLTPKQKAPSFKMVTPKGEDVKQVYQAPDGSLYDRGELERGIKDDEGNLHIVSQDHLKEASTSELPKNLLKLDVYDRVEVETTLYPSEHKSYVFEPSDDDPDNITMHQMLLALLERTDFAFLGVCNLRGYEGLYRLVNWRHRLVFQRQLYPDEVNPHEPLEYATISDTDFDKIAKAVNKITKDFDPDKFQNAETARKEVLADAALAGDIDYEPEPVESKDEGFDTDTLVSMFEGWYDEE